MTDKITIDSSKQTKAQRIAEAMDKMAGNVSDDTLSKWDNPDELMTEAAAEMRRLSAVNEELLEALAWISEYIAAAPEGLEEAHKWGQIAKAIIARHSMSSSEGFAARRIVDALAPQRQPLTVGEIYTAIRRAIVRAAAEIGKCIK